jgi:hypothetical protein
VKLSFKHCSSALVYKNMSSRSCANIRGRIEQRYALVLTDASGNPFKESRRQTMRMAFVTVVCSAVVPVAASLLVLPAAAQDPRACGGYGRQGWWCQPACGGYGPQDPRCYRGYGFYERREREEREERRERRRRDFFEDRRERRDYYWR